MEREVEMECVICGSKLKKRSYLPYIPKQSGRIYGPGSANTATEKDWVIDGYHCPKCGIEYHKLPS